jgi:hypothetical protein
MDLKHARPRSTALYNKAKLGHDIIQAVAEYNPATFEDDTNFSEFISNVDAYITTQSILQQALTDDLKRRQEDSLRPGAGQPPGDGYAGGPVTSEMPAAPTASPIPTPTGIPVPAGAGATNPSANGHPPSDEWDF